MENLELYHGTMGNVYNPHGPLISAFPILRKVSCVLNAVYLAISSRNKKIKKFKNYSLKLWSYEQSIRKSLDLGISYDAET